MKNVAMTNGQNVSLLRELREGAEAGGMEGLVSPAGNLGTDIFCGYLLG
jgi:hypothetical protein